MSLALDHLVVAARTLEEGADWLAARGLATVPGGRHDLMGTHNRLLALGDGAYLEVIAIDPDAPPPGRPRWFGLDSGAMQERLAEGPALVHWVARTTGFDHPREIAGDLVGEGVALSRGEYRWTIGVPADGALPGEGAFPTLIRWEGASHPADALPDEGYRLESLAVRSPRAPLYAEWLALMGWEPPPAFDLVKGEGPGLTAVIRTPGGMAILPERSRRE